MRQYALEDMDTLNNTACARLKTKNKAMETHQLNGPLLGAEIFRRLTSNRISAKTLRSSENEDLYFEDENYSHKAINV